VAASFGVFDLRTTPPANLISSSSTLGRVVGGGVTAADSHLLIDSSNTRPVSISFSGVTGWIAWSDVSVTAALTRKLVALHSPLAPHFTSGTLNSNPRLSTFVPASVSSTVTSTATRAGLMPHVTRLRQRWTTVNPTIKLLELDAGNVCAETPTDASGNHVVGQLFAAKCDLSNINQQFIMHPNGAFEVNDGPLLSNVDGGMCLGVLGGSLKQGAALQTMPCSSASDPYMALIVDADAARMRWQAHPDRVLGIDTTSPSKPALGVYRYVKGDHTQKWRPSLGEAAVMIKNTDNDLCLDRFFKAQTCTVKPSNTCSRNPEVNTANANDQAFVLRNGDASNVAIMAADGGNHCASVGGAEGAAVQVQWCDYRTDHWFKVNATEQSIASASSRMVFTLENDVMESNTSVVINTGAKMLSQRWDVLPARQSKCARHCLQDGGDGSCPPFGVLDGGACSSGVCVEGLCGDEEGIYGKKAICCGEHGIDRHCLNARANRGDGVTKDNWCMACSGNDDHGGLTGCKTPAKLPSNGQLPTTGTHLRCSFDNANDINVQAGLHENQDLNNDLTYLAITGREASIKPSKLHKSFPNLKHLDMAGSAASGFLLDSDTVESWKQLEHLNVSECTKLCEYTSCFHTNLGVMKRLRVLDMSSMGLSVATKLDSLRTLNSLEELYLNDNQLESLPANFFDNMLKLTKLRLRGNPISTQLPAQIYTRVPNFDCDVAPHQTPDTPFTKSPTALPTVEQPSAFPTFAPSKNPTTPAPTAPTSQPTSTAPSAHPTSVKEPAVPTTRSPSVASAAAGDNTLVFALAGVAAVVIVIVIVAVVMIKKKKAAEAAGIMHTESSAIAAVVADKLPHLSEEYL
jgi:hypothetical protein